MMVLYDCIEVARYGGRNPEGLLTMVLLAPTIILPYKYFTLDFLTEETD